MASEALKKIANELKFTRESNSITLQQIAAKTKIDLKFLQAIEDANFDILPEIYIRAFIKEYSQTIDLNPKEILIKFDKARSGQQDERPPGDVSSEATHLTEQKEETDTEIKSFETAHSTETISNEATANVISPAKEPTSLVTLKANYVIGSIILVVAISLIYFSFFNGSSSDIIQVQSNQDNISSNNGRFEFENQTSTSDKLESQIPNNTLPRSPDSLRLSVLTTDRVWLKISSDGKILEQGIYEANSKMNYTATKNFSISIGNAGRVKVYFNNNPVENVGKPGDIRNLFITSDGIKYYTIPPKKNEEKSTTTH